MTEGSGRPHSHTVADKDHRVQYDRQPNAAPTIDGDRVPTGPAKVVQHYIDHAGRPTVVIERDGRTDTHHGEDQLHYFPDGPAKTKWRLTQEAEGLANRPWRETSADFRALRDQWKLAGSADRSTEAVLWQRFRAAQDLHYEQRAREWAHAREVKERLVTRAEALVQRDDKAAYDEMRSIFQEWKNAPRGSKEDEDRIWPRFRAAKDAFDKRSRDRRDAAKQAKERIAREAEGLATSTDWKNTGDRYRRLMDDWKQAGSAGKDDDDRLWSRFDGARKRFTAGRQKHFDDQDRQRKQAESRKRAIISEAQSASRSDNLKAAAERMRALSEQWKQSGKADRAVEDQLWAQFNAARDTLALRRKERAEKWERDATRAKDIKQGIISEAQRLSYGPDYRLAKERMGALTDEWKTAGRASREDEDRLWAQFKAAKDALYANAKAAGEQRRREAAQRLRDAIDRKRDALTRTENFIREQEARYHEVSMRPEPSFNNPRRWEIASRRNDTLSRIRGKIADGQARRASIINQISEMESKWRSMV